MTKARMSRYLMASKGNTRKAVTLYRKNLQLTQELFTIIGCFEIVLRNSIDRVCVDEFGEDWLKNSVATNGIFDNQKCRITKNNINKSISKLPIYNHNKLIAELGFGFWRYMFAQNQFNATNRILLKVFPSKPTSTPTLQYNNIYIFKELAKLNKLRNRMAHHEPICFEPGKPIKNTTYVRHHYNLILQLFQWMQINVFTLLLGLDHINKIM